MNVKVIPDTKLDFNNVNIAPKPTTLSSRLELNILRKFSFKDSPLTWEGFPIISANMDSISTFDMAKALHKERSLCALHKHYSIHELSDFYQSDKDLMKSTFYTLGMNDSDLEKYNYLKKILGQSLPFICLDVANGYMSSFLDFVKKFKDENPDSVLLAGNVVTPEGAVNLLNAGASIVKIGIGSGSLCRTRVVAGVGMPQLSAILETQSLIESLGGHSCSDGGIVEICDVAKALGAGADFVMMGGLLAGHDESGGDLTTDEFGNKFKLFYGMSSETAMNKYNGGMKNHRSSEGRTVKVPYKGAVLTTINTIQGGVRSAMTYTDSKDLIDLKTNVQFLKSNQILNLSLAHHTIGH